MTGELDLARPPMMQRSLSRVAHGGDLVIDLSGVTFIDCAGLGALVGALDSACGGTFRFAEVPERVRRVLELTG